MQPIIPTIMRGIRRESPSILTGLGITGIATTVILAVRATPLALDLLEDERAKRYKEKINPVDPSKIDTIRIVWKCYLPAALVGLTTVACFVGANSINLKRNAALATLYSVSEAALKDYQEKIIEVVGKNKAEKIKEAVIQKELDRHPYSDSEVILTGKGETLFFDSWSGRYFKSDIETVRQIQNDLNAALLGGDMFLSVNGLYDKLGLERILAGDLIGWNYENGSVLNIEFSAKIAKDEKTPCIVMKYRPLPKDL